MDTEQAKQVIQNAIDGRPNSCISEHARGLKEVYDLLNSQAPASAPPVVADAPRATPAPSLRAYTIQITLEETIPAYSKEEAWEDALDLLSGRDGMMIVAHRITGPIEEESP